jgi:hypothetical protein
MKNAVFLDLTQCGFCKNRPFGVFLRSALRLLAINNAVSSLSILVTLMMDAILSSETSVLTRATQRHIQEDDILQSTF